MNIRNSKRLVQTRIPTDEEIIAMLNREDYYLILKIRHTPKNRLGLKWNTMRTKFTILNRYGKLYDA